MSEKNEFQVDGATPFQPIGSNEGHPDVKDDQIQGQSPKGKMEIETSASQGTEIGQQLLTTLTEISAELSTLNSTIESRLRYDKVKEEAFDRLYAELEEMKRNSAFEYIRPLYSDLILLFDRIENTRYNIGQSAPETSNLSHLLETLSDELLELLYRREIETIQTTLSTFDPTIQRAIGTEPVSVDVENNQIVRVVRRGFKYRDRIIRPEEVIVKKYSPTNDKASS